MTTELERCFKDFPIQLKKENEEIAREEREIGKTPTFEQLATYIGQCIHLQFLKTKKTDTYSVWYQYYDHLDVFSQYGLSSIQHCLQENIKKVFEVNNPYVKNYEIKMLIHEKQRYPFPIGIRNMNIRFLLTKGRNTVPQFQAMSQPTPVDTNEASAFKDFTIDTEKTKDDIDHEEKEIGKTPNFDKLATYIGQCIHTKYIYIRILTNNIYYQYNDHRDMFGKYSDSYIQNELKEHIWKVFEIKSPYAKIDDIKILICGRPHYPHDAINTNIRFLVKMSDANVMPHQPQPMPQPQSSPEDNEDFFKDYVIEEKTQKQIDQENKELIHKSFSGIMDYIVREIYNKFLHAEEIGLSTNFFYQYYDNNNIFIAYTALHIKEELKDNIVQYIVKKSPKVKITDIKIKIDGKSHLSENTNIRLFISWIHCDETASGTGKLVQPLHLESGIVSSSPKVGPPSVDTNDINDFGNPEHFTVFTKKTQDEIDKEGPMLASAILDYIVSQISNEFSPGTGNNIHKYHYFDVGNKFLNAQYSNDMIKTELILRMQGSIPYNLNIAVKCVLILGHQLILINVQKKEIPSNEDIYTYIVKKTQKAEEERKKNYEEQKKKNIDKTINILMVKIGNAAEQGKCEANINYVLTKQDQSYVNDFCHETEGKNIRELLKNNIILKIGPKFSVKVDNPENYPWEFQCTVSWKSS